VTPGCVVTRAAWQAGGAMQQILPVVDGSFVPARHHGRGAALGTRPVSPVRPRRSLRSHRATSSPYLPGFPTAAGGHGLRGAGADRVGLRD
jgi:hypothetical protein